MKMSATLFGREPVLYLALAQATLALAVGFGLGLTGEQVSAILAFTATVLGLITRFRVTPVSAGTAGA